MFAIGGFAVFIAGANVLARRWLIQAQDNLLGKIGEAADKPIILWDLAQSSKTNPMSNCDLFLNAYEARMRPALEKSYIESMTSYWNTPERTGERSIDTRVCKLHHMTSVDDLYVEEAMGWTGAPADITTRKKFNCVVNVPPASYLFDTDLKDHAEFIHIILAPEKTDLSFIFRTLSEKSADRKISSLHSVLYIGDTICINAFIPA